MIWFEIPTSPKLVLLGKMSDILLTIRNKVRFFFFFSNWPWVLLINALLWKSVDLHVAQRNFLVHGIRKKYVHSQKKMTAGFV